MKPWPIGGALALAFATAPTIACDWRDDHHTQAKPSDGTRTAGDDFAHSRDRLVQNMHAKLADLDRKLSTLRTELAARVRELSAEDKAALANTIARLEDKRAAAAIALEQAESATADRWKDVEKRTHDALKAIDDAYDAAVNKLRERRRSDG